MYAAQKKLRQHAANEFDVDHGDDGELPPLPPLPPASPSTRAANRQHAHGLRHGVAETQFSDDVIDQVLRAASEGVALDGANGQEPTYDTIQRPAVNSDGANGYGFLTGAQAQYGGLDVGQAYEVMDLRAPGRSDTDHGQWQQPAHGGLW